MSKPCKFMQLLIDLRQAPELLPFICDDCEENGVAVNISMATPKDSYVIIKPDKYYNENIPSPETPPSPDCLIVQHCNENRYVIYVVELKKIGDMKNQRLSHIREKFQTCLRDFMSNRFRDYFYNEEYDFLNSINLVFVSMPRETENNSKGRTTRLDSLLALPPCEFANRKYFIKHKIPNPIIQPCH